MAEPWPITAEMMDEHDQATHLLIGLPGGPIPVRRIDWHFQEPEQSSDPELAAADGQAEPAEPAAPGA
jgi:hypothetical protein